MLQIELAGVAQTFEENILKPSSTFY